MADSCFKCLSTCGCKYVLLICNIVLLVLGLALSVFGGFLGWKRHSEGSAQAMELMTNDLMKFVGVVAIVLIIAGIMGICFSMNRSRCLGITYLIFISLAVLISVAYVSGPETFYKQLAEKASLQGVNTPGVGEIDQTAVNHRNKVWQASFNEFSVACGEEAESLPQTFPAKWGTFLDASVDQTLLDPEVDRLTVEEVRCAKQLDQAEEDAEAKLFCPKIDQLMITSWFGEGVKEEDSFAKTNKRTLCRSCTEQLAVAKDDSVDRQVRIFVFCRSLHALHAYFSVGSMRLSMLLLVFVLVVLVLAIWLVICGPESQEGEPKQTKHEIEMVAA